MQNVGQNQLVVAKRGPAALFRENDRNNFHRMLVIAEYLVSTMRVTVLSQSDKKIGAHRSIFDQSFGIGQRFREQSLAVVPGRWGENLFFF